MAFPDGGVIFSAPRFQSGCNALLIFHSLHHFDRSTIRLMSGNTTAGAIGCAFLMNLVRLIRSLRAAGYSRIGMLSSPKLLDPVPYRSGPSTFLLHKWYVAGWCTQSVKPSGHHFARADGCPKHQPYSFAHCSPTPHTLSRASLLGTAL